MLLQDLLLSVMVNDMWIGLCYRKKTYNYTNIIVV